MRRLLLLAVGAGLVLTAVPAFAETRAGSAASADRRVERDALRVLERAVHAAHSVDYRGRQHVASSRDGGAALLDVAHRPGRASVLRGVPRAGDPLPVAATAALDARLVGLLAQSYDLAVTGSGRCTGRTTSVVEARRDGGQVAGRFWVDEDSGLLLRREVYDTAGARVRSSAFVSLEVRGAADLPAVEPSMSPEAVAAAADDLRAQGWQVPDRLPEGFRLFDARLSAPSGDEHVLHLAYSDGLSTTSLFVQQGQLGTAPPDGFAADTVEGRPVWVHDAAPARVVWSGAGTVWTLVSDAPARTVRAAVAVLPRDRAPEDGLVARLARGLDRVVSALSPF